MLRHGVLSTPGGGNSCNGYLWGACPKQHMTPGLGPMLTKTIFPIGPGFCLHSPPPKDKQKPASEDQSVKFINLFTQDNRTDPNCAYFLLSTTRAGFYNLMFLRWHMGLVYGKGLTLCVRLHTRSGMCETGHTLSNLTPPPGGPASIFPAPDPPPPLSSSTFLLGQLDGTRFFTFGVQKNGPNMGQKWKIGSEWDFQDILVVKNLLFFLHTWQFFWIFFCGFDFLVSLACTN